MTRSMLRRHIVRLSPRGSRSQKKNWLGWLSTYRPGYSGRANWDRSPEFIYNHLESVPMLVWLAEVAGVPRFALMKAKAAVLKAGPNDASQAAALRRILPWCLVEALLNAR